MSFKVFIARPSVIVTNVVVTFVQAAFATWLAAGLSTDKLAVAGAVGAGASAVWNVLLKPYLTSKGWLRA